MDITNSESPKLLRRKTDQFEELLRKLCGRLTPEKRIVVIVTLVILFAAANIWITFRAIYNIGREDTKIEFIEITPIEVPDFELDGGEPSELQMGIEEYFKRNFKSEEDDTTNTQQEQAEP